MNYCLIYIINEYPDAVLCAFCLGLILIYYKKRKSKLYVVLYYFIIVMNEITNVIDVPAVYLVFVQKEVVHIFTHGFVFVSVVR